MSEEENIRDKQVSFAQHQYRLAESLQKRSRDKREKIKTCTNPDYKAAEVLQAGQCNLFSVKKN